MKKYFSTYQLIIIATCLFLLSSACKNNYYLCYAYEPVTVYEDKNVKCSSFVIPPGKQLIVETRRRKYRQVKFGNNLGYIRVRRFPNEWKYLSKDVNSLVFNSDSTYYDRRYVTSVPVKPKPSSSLLPSASSTNSSDGAVQVKGYYRKDGTYVRPYTRSAPRRKG